MFLERVSSRKGDEDGGKVRGQRSKELVNPKVASSKDPGDAGGVGRDNDLYALYRSLSAQWGDLSFSKFAVPRSSSKDAPSLGSDPNGQQQHHHNQQQQQQRKEDEGVDFMDGLAAIKQSPKFTRSLDSVVFVVSNKDDHLHYGIKGLSLDQQPNVVVDSKRSGEMKVHPCKDLDNHQYQQQKQQKQKNKMMIGNDISPSHHDKIKDNISNQQEQKEQQEQKNKFILIGNGITSSSNDKINAICTRRHRRQQQSPHRRTPDVTNPKENQLDSQSGALVLVDKCPSSPQKDVIYYSTDPLVRKKQMENNENGKKPTKKVGKNCLNKNQGDRHSNHCSKCNKYCFLFKTRCLVCGRCYCNNCVKDAMGDMPEGRKCQTCLGNCFHERYVGRAGKCWFGLSKEARREEIKWAKKRLSIQLTNGRRYPRNHPSPQKKAIHPHEKTMSEIGLVI